MQRVQTGLTLVELMVTLAVLIIAITVVRPTFDSVIKSNHNTSHTNELIGALRLARSEAVKRGEWVVVCPSNAKNNACESSNWQNGWLVFSDPNNNHTYERASDELIRVWLAPEGGIVFNNAPEYIRFHSSGELSGDVPDFAVQFSGCSGNRARTISISRMGRAEATRSACF
jgi:type IV fimbrial biogenesis protein FimT